MPRQTKRRVNWQKAEDTGMHPVLEGNEDPEVTCTTTLTATAEHPAHLHQIGELTDFAPKISSERVLNHKDAQYAMSDAEIGRAIMNLDKMKTCMPDENFSKWVNALVDDAVKSENKDYQSGVKTILSQLHK
jgi:hypothetical protein